jgi:hypothetical protein
MNPRQYLHDKIISKLKEKAVSRYSYGGYVFFPTGEIKKKEAYSSSLNMRADSLRIDPYVSTMECSAYVSLDKIDPYLLVDCLNDLSGLSKTTEASAHQYDAEWIYKHEVVERHQWQKGCEWLAQRSVIANAIRGIEHLPVHVELTDDFESYAKRLGQWVKISIAKDSPTAIKKVLGRKLLKKKAKVTA